MDRKPSGTKTQTIRNRARSIDRSPRRPLQWDSAAVNEQRKAQRFELKLQMTLVRTGSRDVLEVCETRNVSSGGVLFRSLAPIAVGTVIEYVIQWPALAPETPGVSLRCVGKVIRLDGDLEVDDPNTTTVAATLERYQFVRVKVARAS